MRQIWITAVAHVVLLAGPVTAQQLPQSWRSTAKNAAFLELGGSAGLYSMNLDHRLNNRLTFRAALAQYTSIELGDQPSREYMRLAFMLNVLTGGPSDWLELGIGPMAGKWTQTIVDNWFWSMTSAIGYRHQARTDGFVFRAAVAPQFQFRSKRARSGASVWPGLSFGISF